MERLNNPAANRMTEPGYSLEYPIQLIHINTGNPYSVKTDFHWHDEIEALRLNSGTLSIQLEDRELVLHEGQSVVIMPKHVHHFEPHPNEVCDFDLFILHPSFLFGHDKASLNAKYLAPLLVSKDKYFYCLDMSAEWHREASVMIDRIIQYNQERSYGYELYTKGILCELWLLFLQQLSVSERFVQKAQPTLPSSRVRNAILYIEAHYAEAVTLEEIADSIHVSKSECCRSFKRSLNMTPFEYLMKFRIYSAASKIAANDPVASSISSLAAAVGFNNTSYFNKVFRGFLGCTPTQYRKDLASYNLSELLPTQYHSS